MSTRRPRRLITAIALLLAAAYLTPAAAQDRTPTDAKPVRTNYTPDTLPPADEPSTQAVYVTWQRDPTTTLTAQWIGPLHPQWASAAICRAPELPQSPDTLRYTSVPARWQAVPGTDNRMAYSAEFINLAPDTPYLLAIPGRDEPLRVRTLPADGDQPLRFVAAGCAYKNKKPFEAMTRAVAHHDPHFALFAGDIAYADGDPNQADRWLYFLSTWENLARRSDGSLIPLVMTIGNHEVSHGGRGKTKAYAPFFYSLFAFPAPTGYGVLDIGDHTSLFLLDSGHTNPVPGHQTDWLAGELAARQDRTHLVAAYHVPAYPSVRGFNNHKNREVRRHWSPLFDEHGVALAIEADDHAYKRTLPLRDGRPEPRGTVYIGDGGFGMTHLRAPAEPGTGSAFGNRRPYLARTAEVTHGELVTLHGNERSIISLDPDGVVIDAYRFAADQPHPIDATPRTSLLFRPEGYLTAAAIVLAIAGYFGFSAWRTRHPASVADA
ncbi:MAG: metallophosphoesterase [Planctomycetota bacterium]